MYSPLPTTQDRKDLPVGPARVSVPILSILWMARCVLRLVLRSGIYQPRPRPEMFAPGLGLVNNRQLRRAKAACMRRAIRHKRRGRRFDPYQYMPRAFDICSALALAPEGISHGRFREFYASESGLGRAAVFGLSARHEITAFTQEAMAGFLPFSLAEFPALNSCGPADDPAPP